jgi:hypothetical protein
MVARSAHALQIYLRFGHHAREVLHVTDSAGPGDFACEQLDLLGQYRVGMNRHAQPVA